MAIKQLTPEQVRTWTREQKDRWWLENVFRGNMPQLTIRSAITGFLLGGMLSATNLYIGAKTGWTLGVGLTSVILAFATFKVLSSLRVARDMTILENNAMQSIATSAGYMTGPLISGIAAYMMVTNTLMPWWQMLVFNVILSLLGVLVAFPMKRRFINDEQAPFPEGRACGVVLDTLYTSDARVGLFKAQALAFAAIIAGGLKFASGEAYQTLLQGRLLGLSKIHWMSEHLDKWYYDLVASGRLPLPTISGIDIRKLGLSPTLDLAMFGAGGLMNIRYALNMFIGMIVAYVFAAPYAITHGWVSKKGVVLTPASDFTQRDVLTSWLLWPGVAMLVCASMASFLAKPQVIISAFTGMFSRKPAGTDVLKDIELPLKVSWIGIPIIGAVAVYLTHEWFGVRWDLGALAVLMTIALTLIAANATALTSITPTGSLSKITQFTFGMLDKGHAPTNLMTATITTEVASNASNLLMDIKPGYMLGAKPRQQAIGHCIGIFAGALASTPLFYILFLAGHPQNPFTAVDPNRAQQTVEDVLLKKPDGSAGDFSFVAAVQWKGISEFIAGLTGEGGLTKIVHPSALYLMAACAFVGVAFELLRVFTKGKSPFAPLAFGLGILLPPDSTFWMFLGSLFFFIMSRAYGGGSRSDPHGVQELPGESFGHRLWVRGQEAICAGLIAGAALTGIGDQFIQVFALS